MSVVPYKTAENYFINNDGQKKENPAACVFVARYFIYRLTCYCILINT